MAVDAALKSATDKLAQVVTQLSEYQGAAGSEEIKKVQRALGQASSAYQTLLNVDKPEITPYYYDPYY